MKTIFQPIKILTLLAILALALLTNCNDDPPPGTVQPPTPSATPMPIEPIDEPEEPDDSDPTPPTANISDQIFECGLENPPTTGPAVNNISTWKICLEQPEHPFNQPSIITGKSLCEEQLDGIRRYVPSCDLDGKIKTAADNIVAELGECARPYACAATLPEPSELAIAQVFEFHHALLKDTDKTATQQKCDNSSTAVIESIAPECFKLSTN